MHASYTFAELQLYCILTPSAPAYDSTCLHSNTHNFLLETDISVSAKIADT